MRLGILCPGQGDLNPQMFSILAGRQRASAIFALASQMIGQDCRTLSADQLVINRQAQPALVAYQLAVWAEIQDRLPDIGFFAGYSVGELSAWGLAGALTPEATLGLADDRARLMDGAGQEAGGLIAVRGLTRKSLESICQDYGCWVAIVNGEDRLVVGGRRTHLADLALKLELLAAKVTNLSISVASHTPLMIDAVDPFANALAQVDWRIPNAPILAGLDGTPLRDPFKGQAALSQQIARPIDWNSCLQTLHEMGCDGVLELGPGSALSQMVRDRWPDVPVRSVADFRSLDSVVDWVSRLE